MNEELKAQLIELGLKEDQVQKLADEGVVTIEDLKLFSEQDIKEKTGAGLVTVRKIVATLSPKIENPVTATAMSFGADVLPEIPSEESWLIALRAGGVLKVEQSTVISAIRAALADKVYLYDLPSKIVKAMESFADANAEPVPAKEFFAIRKQLTRKSYAEIFEAIDGLDGSFVTDARKNAFLKKVDELLWPAIVSFYNQLKAWVDAWQQGASNPGMMMNIMATVMAGGKVPAGMISAPPETGTLRDEADALNDGINKVFSGTGAQIAAALAYEASSIKKMLENTQLPSMIGVANREQMLRTLKADVPATYPRLETNLSKFVLGVLKVKDIADGDEALQYFTSLHMLGAQIPWDKLGKGNTLNMGRQL